MHAFRRQGSIVAVVLLLTGWESGARAQVITADRVDLAPTTTTWNGFMFQEGQALLHTWDAASATGVTTNLFLGLSAGGAIDLPLNTGRYNTGVGPWVMYAVTTGTANTAVGSGALEDLLDGGNNTAVGFSALSQTTSGYSNSAIGAGSLAFNTTGSSNVSVGGMTWNTTGSYNTAVGMDSLYESTTGWGNTAVGYHALLGNRGGATNTAVGYQADVMKAEFVNATAIGAGAIATSSNMVRVGNSSVSVIQGQVPFSWVSDRRWKTDVEPLAVGLDFVRRLQPVSYRLRGGNGRLDMGFVAQDVEEIFGDGYNVVARGADDERLLSMRYTDLIAPLVRALQEVDARQQSDDAAVAALRAENAAMVRELGALRARLDALAQPAHR